MVEWLKSVISDPGIISAIKVTFTMAVCSTAISSVLGIVLGLLLERFQFPGKKIVVRINRTLMGVPPVVVGLVVYLLIMRRGPLGPLSLLFTIKGMVIAQTLMKKEIYFCMVTGFGRSISEVGAVMLVGGNIKGRTRTMTTTISLLKSQGIFTEGVALGVLLLVMAFLLQWICDILQKEEAEDENY